jgi:hypothetical protein
MLSKYLILIWVAVGPSELPIRTRVRIMSAKIYEIIVGSVYRFFPEIKNHPEEGMIFGRSRSIY